MFILNKNMNKTNSGLELLIKDLFKQKFITSQRVYNVMLSVDRNDFSPKSPYSDSPQYLNFGSTISAPHMHAFVLEYLKDFIFPGAKVLDVGFGSGYLCVAFSKLMNDEGLVVGIEHIPELCLLGENNIKKNYSLLLEKKNIILNQGDGRDGLDQYSPYNCIHVGAASEEIPNNLIKQLAKGGRMIIPVGNEMKVSILH